MKAQLKFGNDVRERYAGPRTLSIKSLRLSEDFTFHPAVGAYGRVVVADGRESLTQLANDKLAAST